MLPAGKDVHVICAIGVEWQPMGRQNTATMAIPENYLYHL